MSATNSTAINGQSSHVSPLAAAVALAGIVAFAAAGLAISHGVGVTSSAGQPAAGPAVVTGHPVSGPRSVVTPYSASGFGAQYDAWMQAQEAAAAVFPDYFQRLDVGNISTPYSGSEFGAQYNAWLLGQKAAAAADFPDYFQRVDVRGASASGPVTGRISNQSRLPR